MALTSIWYYTNLPEDIVDIIERDLTEAQVESRSFYKWDEENLAWVLETPPAPEETEE